MTCGRPREDDQDASPGHASACHFYHIDTLPPSSDGTGTGVTPYESREYQYPTESRSAEFVYSVAPVRY